MTRFSKLLVVVIAAASLGFAAFVGALVTGGPNWRKLAFDLSNLPEFGRQVTFTAPQLPNGPWTATDNRTGQTIGSDPILAAVILKAQALLLTELQSEVRSLKERIEAETTSRDISRQTITTDLAGLEARAVKYSELLKKLAADIDAQTDALSKQGVELSAVQRDRDERRFEVYRLMNQLELLRDDLYASQRQRDALRDELLQLNENRLRLERRQQTLKQQLGASYEQ
jgi:hypothetical protein